MTQKKVDPMEETIDPMEETIAPVSGINIGTAATEAPPPMAPSLSMLNSAFVSAETVAPFTPTPSGQIISGRPDGGTGGRGGDGGIGGFSAPGASGHSYAVLSAIGSDVALENCSLSAMFPGPPIVGVVFGRGGEARLIKQL